MIELTLEHSLWILVGCCGCLIGAYWHTERQARKREASHQAVATAVWEQTPEEFAENRQFVIDTTSGGNGVLYSMSPEDAKEGACWNCGTTWKLKRVDLENKTYFRVYVAPLSKTLQARRQTGNAGSSPAGGTRFVEKD